MNGGLLDLPAPLFDVVDAALHALHAPPLVRVALYAGEHRRILGKRCFQSRNGFAGKTQQ